MKYLELLADPAVRAVRREPWPAGDYVELPPMGEFGRRGPQCFVITHTGKQMTRTAYPTYEIAGAHDNWEAVALPANYAPPAYPDEFALKRAAHRKWAEHRAKYRQKNQL